jgi:hypothetical protein
MNKIRSKIGMKILGILQGELMAIHRAHVDDEALQADVLLENLVTKASRTLAVGRSAAVGIGRAVDYILSCSRSRGDRYQRRGSNLPRPSASLWAGRPATCQAFCAAPVCGRMRQPRQGRRFDRVIVFGRMSVQAGDDSPGT